MDRDSEAAPVAQITGASGGLASATARVPAAKGCRLVLMSRSGAAEIAAQTGGTGVAGSVPDDGGVAHAVQTAIDRPGRLATAALPT